MRGRHDCYWSFPLSDGAVLQFGFGRRLHWLPREAALVDAAAGRCREAAERIRLAQQVRRLEAEARRTEEDERRRIGRELHDEAGAIAAAAAAGTGNDGARSCAAAARARLGEARGVAERTIAELRRIVAALSPAVLERLGLEAALRQLAGAVPEDAPGAVAYADCACRGRDFHPRCRKWSTGLPRSLSRISQSILRQPT